ncbi:MAG: SCP2 sterol-binding domain-containing protein [Acidimicrobiia bacterium]|nr:SCP2 sterol-binding domain-containing protein [Acidimicrobiia bacterium]
MTAIDTGLLFPSTAWFRALAEAVAADEPRYRRLGYVDLTLGVRVGDAGFRLVFEDFGCSAVEEWDGGAPVDCVVSASAEDWQELVGHIQGRGSADPRHTLNSLVLAGDRFTLAGDEQLGVDAFYRFNATLQAFVEEAAKVPTRFA